MANLCFLTAKYIFSIAKQQNIKSVLKAIAKTNKKKVSYYKKIIVKITIEHNEASKVNSFGKF